MNDYTNIMDSMLDTVDGNKEEYIDFLTDENNFRSFGESLRYLIQKKVSCVDPKEYVKSCLKEKGITFNRNTLNNWFDGNKPKKGDKTREKVYQVAFALDFNTNETEELFIKAYYDRPFDLRNINEFVYYYCMKNGLSYNNAQEIIGEINSMQDCDYNAFTCHTNSMRKELDEIKSVDELKFYVKNNLRNFSYNNVSAQRVLDSLIESVILTDEDMEKIRTNTVDSTCNIMAREISLCRDSSAIEMLKYADPTSKSSMMNFILNVNFTRKREDKIQVIRNANLVKEIKSRFPSKHSFKENPSYEELRKMIILLASYKFWFNEQYIDQGYGVEDFECEINDYLNDANMAPLYKGNPYDWIFYYCTMDEDVCPLDLFRQIMSDTLDGDD